MEATLNVRIDAPLKARGDKVLREHGISTSAAVRALWQEMANTRTLPRFISDASEESAARKRKAHALDALAGIAAGALSNCTDAELDAVGMARYE